MNSNKKTARIAGFWYLLLGITAGYSWLYTTKVFVAGNAALTANNILQSESQYLIAIVSSLIGQISFIILGFALYRLLKHVNETHAKLMLAFMLVSVPIMFVNIIFQTGALFVLNRADYLNAFSKEQINSISMLIMNFHFTGLHIVEIFWGLWLFPLSYLVYKSNYFPKILALLLIIAGLCYLIGSLAYLLNLKFYSTIQIYLSIPESVGELSIVFWLLIKGVKGQKAFSKQPYSQQISF